MPLNPEHLALPPEAADDSAVAADLAYLRARIEASDIDPERRGTMTDALEVLSVLLADRHSARTFVLTVGLLEQLAAGEGRAPSPAELPGAIKRYGSQRAASRALGIPRSTLRYRLRRVGQDGPPGSMRSQSRRP